MKNSKANARIVLNGEGLPEKYVPKQLFPMTNYLVNLEGKPSEGAPTVEVHMDSINWASIMSVIENKTPGFPFVYGFTGKSAPPDGIEENKRVDFRYKEHTTRW